MPRIFSGPWTTAFLGLNSNNPLFENIGAIALMRTHLCLQVFRLETLILRNDAVKFPGFRCTVPGQSTLAKAVRQCIRKKLDQSTWSRYSDLMGVADIAIGRADFFSDNLWASPADKPEAFIMVNVQSIMDWHIRKMGLQPPPPPLPVEEQLSRGISGLEYNGQEFADLRASMRFITDEIAEFTHEFEKARHFVDGLLCKAPLKR